MDVQQIITFALVAAAVATIVLRLRRMRKRRLHAGCASCPAVEADGGDKPSGDSVAGDRGPET